MAPSHSLMPVSDRSHKKKKKKVISRKNNKKYWGVSENSGGQKKKIISEFNHRTIKDNKQQGYCSEDCWYFCSAMSSRFLCLDLNKSKPAPDNPKCYKLTPDLTPIAAKRAIDIIGAKPVKIHGETYFVGGMYSFNEAEYSLRPDLYRLRIQHENKGTPEFLSLKRRIGHGMRMEAVKVNPIVEEIEKKLYVLHTGGGDGNVTVEPVFEVFDRSTLTWSALQDPPFIEEGCYECPSFVRGHSVIGKRLFVITADKNCYCFDTNQGEWQVLSPFVLYNGYPLPRVGRVLLWTGISCGTQSSVKVPRQEYQVGEDHYIYFSRNYIYLVDSDGIVLAEQKGAFDAIFKGLAPRPLSGSYMDCDNGMIFLPSPRRGTMCAATLIHEMPEDEDEDHTVPTLCISFFRPVIYTSLVNSILDGSYKDANPGTDFTNLNLVGVEQDFGYVFDFSEHFDFDGITDLGFSGPAFFP